VERGCAYLTALITARFDRIAPVEQSGRRRVLPGAYQCRPRRARLCARHERQCHHRHRYRGDVLLVPNWAIRIDRASGRTYVNRLSGSTVHEVEVKTGLRNETDSQVTGGVQEGDVIIVGGCDRARHDPPRGDQVEPGRQLMGKPVHRNQWYHKIYRDGRRGGTRTFRRVAARRRRRAAGIMGPSGSGKSTPHESRRGASDQPL